jgi:hypothetical protein
VPYFLKNGSAQPGLVLRANVAPSILLTEYDPAWHHRLTVNQRGRTRTGKSIKDLIGEKAMTPMPFAVVGLLLFTIPASAQTQPSPATPVPPAAESAAKAAFTVLPGRWVRVEGGYVITINSVEADGRLDASYANPRPLPFHTAVASSDGNSLKLFFELRAAGYNGSTYTLNYDAANDRLTGVYDQVVVKQKFEVVFVRSKP